jgi:hypothetical protein
LTKEKLYDIINIENEREVNNMWITLIANLYEMLEDGEINQFDKIDKKLLDKVVKEIQEEEEKRVDKRKKI